MTVRTSHASRTIHAPPDALYAAFLDPEALVEWLPPDRMTGVMHAFDARVGGGHEMSLLYPPEETRFQGKTAAREDRVRVRFVALEPPSRIVETVRFVSDDAAFAGEMTITITIDGHANGSSTVIMTFDGLPPGLRPEDNDAGARASLDQLARRFE
jgi:uncharacterized protein YndB with AHSA1/START domain